MGSPAVQQPKAIAHGDDHALFYAGSCHTVGVVQFAAVSGVALFQCDDDGDVTPVNETAAFLGTTDLTEPELERAASWIKEYIFAKRHLEDEAIPIPARLSFYEHSEWDHAVVIVEIDLRTAAINYLASVTDMVTTAYKRMDQADSLLAARYEVISSGLDSYVDAGVGAPGAIFEEAISNGRLRQEWIWAWTGWLHPIGLDDPFMGIHREMLQSAQSRIEHVER